MSIMQLWDDTTEMLWKYLLTELIDRLLDIKTQLLNLETDFFLVFLLLLSMGKLNILQTVTENKSEINIDWFLTNMTSFDTNIKV